MAVQNDSQEKKKYGPARLVIGGCAGLLLCVVLALAVNASYWTWRIRVGGAGVQLPREDLQAELVALPSGSAERGERIFTGEAGCQACHSLESGGPGSGPSLSGISQRAAETKEGYSTELYLYESIIYPQAYLVDEYQNGMPAMYQKTLDQQSLADLIAFLMER